MPQTATQMTDHFPLAHFERALDGFQPPTEAFDPQGAWVNAYDVWECSQGSRKIGVVRIERTPLEARRARLDVGFRKGAAGGVLRAEMSFECRTDTLATPIRWQAQTAVHDPQDAAIEDTRLSETGEVGERALRVKVGGTVVQTPLPELFTVDWSLFDAVQRLPGEALEPLAFTLVDRLNQQMKPGQRLAFRSAPTIELGGKRIWREEKRTLERGAVYRPVSAREGATVTRLRAYDQTGRGLVPIVYWVDERGRLLFVLSGLIGYVLNLEAQP